MSRIGKLPVIIPEGVKVELGEGKLIVSGDRGTLEVNIPKQVKVEIGEGRVRVFSEMSNLHGLVRTLIYNAVKGVAEGWSKSLELSGTGFRAMVSENQLQLNVGFSHQVKITAPEGIEFNVKENKITVSGRDKSLVGEMAARIRKVRPADPYKAKGFKYEGEVIIRKAGKAAKVGASGAA